MFEDSTFASTGRIRMRSRAGFLAAILLDTAIVLALVLAPLLSPQLLPRMMTSMFMSIPAPPVEQPKAPTPAAVRIAPAVLSINPYLAPRTIPRTTDYTSKDPEPAFISSVADMIGSSTPANATPFASPSHVSVVEGVQKTYRVSGLIVEGLLIQKTIPQYPPIARATHTEGTVVLQATISRNGTIENLRVASGSPMLRQAALDAVSTWRYRPYLLNGQPVDVETTINVVFKLEQ